MIKDRIIIIDGYNLFTRHYVAHPAMSENGEQIGGIVGFFNNLTRLIVKCRPESVYIIWEGGGSKRKRDLYSEYKKRSKPQKLNRYYDDIPDSIQNRNFQLSNLIKLISFFPIPPPNILFKAISSIFGSSTISRGNCTWVGLVIKRIDDWLLLSGCVKPSSD